MDTFKVAVRVCAAASRARRRERDARATRTTGVLSLTVAGIGVQGSCPMARAMHDHAGAGPRHRGSAPAGSVRRLERKLGNGQRVVQRRRVRAGHVRPAVRQRERSVSRCGAPGPVHAPTRLRRVAFDVPATNPGSPATVQVRVSIGDRVAARRRGRRLARTVSVTFEAAPVRAPTLTSPVRPSVIGTVVGSASAKVIARGAERETRARPHVHVSRSGLAFAVAARTPSSTTRAPRPPLRVRLSRVSFACDVAPFRYLPRWPEVVSCPPARYRRALQRTLYDINDSTVGYAVAVVNPHTGAHVKKPKGSAESPGKTAQKCKENGVRLAIRRGPWRPTASTRGTRKGLVR